MYITYDEQTYANVRVYSTSGSVRFTGESLTELTEISGAVHVFADNGFELRAFDPGDFLRQEIKAGSWLLTNAPVPTPQPVVAQPVTYDLATSTANAVRLLMAGKTPEAADEIIQCSALYEEWEAGVHKTGEIFLLDGAPWKVLAAYDNAAHPDIVPGGTAWGTFNIPYHGTTRQTARAWVKPNNATDIYQVGEWCVFDGKYYVSKRGTDFSPAEYPADWEEQE